MSLSHSWKVSCRKCLVVLSLLVGLAGQATAQPTYSFTTLDVPGSFISNSTFAKGINSSGQIAGFSWDGSTAQGFLLDNGSYTRLDVPGATNTFAYGINVSGQVVGSYDGHGFLLDNGSFTTLDVPGATQTFASGINSS